MAQTRKTAKQAEERIVTLKPLSELGDWWTPAEMKKEIQPHPAHESWAWEHGYRPGDYASPDGERIWQLEGWLENHLVCTTTDEEYRLPNGTYPRFNKSIRDQENALQPVPSRTWLYRMYSNNDELLYIGISKSAFARFEQHSHTQSWINQVARWEREPHPTREAALSAERAAIIREHPKHNVVHNRRSA